MAIAEVGNGRGRGGDCFDRGGVCRDQQFDRVGLVIGKELLGEVGDGAWVFEEEPATQGSGVSIKRRDGLREVVDRGGDRSARIKHGIEGGYGVLIRLECVDDRVEDEFATSASNEPVVGEGDPSGMSTRLNRWFGLVGWVYH